MLCNQTSIIPLEESHIPDLWEIVQSCPNFFADDFYIDKIGKFSDYLHNNAIDVIVGQRGAEIVGCCYLESIEDDRGCIAVFIKRHSLHPAESIQLARIVISNYFKKYNFKMIYAVTRIYNKAVIRLFKMLGFGGWQVLKNFRTVNGQPVDYILAGIIREKMEVG